MSDQTPRRIPTLKLVAVAIVLGVAAGAGAVYVTDAPSGNGPANGPAATEEKVAGSGAAASADCASAKTVAAALKPYAVGDVAAMTPRDRSTSVGGLAFEDATGKAMSLTDYAGKTLLVNIWATWCVPCRAEMPTLDRLEAKRGGNDFQVVAINIDTGDASKPAEFLRKIGADHVALHRDPSMSVFDDLKKEGLAFGLPVTLLVGARGCLLAAMNGPAEWDGADAERLVDAAVKLQAKAPAPPKPM